MSLTRKKGKWVPCQGLVWLGLHWNLAQGSLEIPEKNVWKKSQRRSVIFGVQFMAIQLPRGGTLIFCGYIGEAPASTPKPKKLLRFADHPKKIPVLSGIPKKILELLAYPKKLHVFIFLCLLMKFYHIHMI